jgi:nucleoside-diphosphate-sugar epimerase
MAGMRLPQEDLEQALSDAADSWKELQGANLFITGGSGFFGRWLLETFTFANERLGLDAHATVLTRNATAFRAQAPYLANHPALTLLEGDMLTLSLSSSRFSHIIHAAIDSNLKSASPHPQLSLFDSIVSGTRRMLEFAVKCDCRKFLLTSSGAVYGPQPSELMHLPETFSGAPNPGRHASVYREAKRAAEVLCSIYHKEFGLETKIARCFAFVGPHLPLNLNFAIGNFIRDLLTGQAIEIQGDGTPYRSYLYASDLAVWLWKILCAGRPAQPYNVGSENEISIAELAHLVSSFSSPAVKVSIARAAAPNAPAERYVPSTKLAREELGLNQRIPLKEAIRRTVDWQRR